jgi:hypothetical protein
LRGVVSPASATTTEVGDGGPRVAGDAQPSLPRARPRTYRSHTRRGATLVSQRPLGETSAKKKNKVCRKYTLSIVYKSQIWRNAHNLTQFKKKKTFPLHSALPNPLPPPPPRPSARTTTYTPDPSLHNACLLSSHFHRERCTNARGHAHKEVVGGGGCTPHPTQPHTLRARTPARQQ